MVTLATIIQHSFGSPSHGNQRRKRNKRIHTGKEVKLSLFADDMILYIENPKDATRKLLELGFPGGAVVKNPPANAEDMGSSPGLGRSHMPRSN